MPGTENIKVLDALLLAGIKASHLIGRSPAPITYYVNDKKKTLRGTPSTPGEIYVNKDHATLDTEVRQGDEITVVFAQSGIPPEITVSDICDGFGKTILSVTVNGKKAKGGYSIQHNDVVNVCADIDDMDEIDDFDKNGLNEAYDITSKTDIFESAELQKATEADLTARHKASCSVPSKPQPVKSVLTIRVCINVEWTEIPTEDNEPPLFLDMLNFVDIDTKAAKGDLILSINGNRASYTDNVHDGDKVYIRWSN
jgi:ribosomal 50S subunit-recycling heat shock protein